MSLLWGKFASRLIFAAPAQEQMRNRAKIEGLLR
ncbi:hypothetical protein CYA_2768 [Synechococcus sp. JA-3-3Ab]|nr:hypothetical protein CYA_2768 [Synechococcus sp. JA-3-3Ab]